MAVDHWEVDDFGLRHDRRFMVVDGAGEFISQRNAPRLALVVPTVLDDTLRVEAPGMPPLELPLDPRPTVVTQVTVWNDTGPATWLGEEAARWFSDFLGCASSLVYMNADTRRPTDPAYDSTGSRVSFADAFPFLLISEESLADLNRRLAVPMPMNRFRPNLVVAGAQAFDEDRWDRIEIGGLGLRLVKPCARCVITTTDQTTAERGQEPLRTLATYRNIDGKVNFGQNGVHHGSGFLSLGDRVQVKSDR
jgi:uncharacterized protein YcbX